METTTKTETGWSHAREADPFSLRQSLALAVGVGGIIAALGAVLVTAATMPREAGGPGHPPIVVGEVRR